ncbi:protein kinase [Streptomyces sp. NBC_01275]|uniref:protein kinase domain-containing protein n=1 Tax=Streptomyces sp. NBC_01275 TaxID=2903807 RepID=UPI002251A2E7|nr:protein kinase [Streptomyces sp. NBC_01275]MCX4766887.1 protein kinase [Streptomyces sp. NBC_01275]
MSDQRPPTPSFAAKEAAALRQTGASPLRVGDPDRVGPFVPVAILGSGGMGRVYLARSVDDGPGLFAVKVIRPEYAEDVRFQRRFAREVEVHAQVGPPYAPRLRGSGWTDHLLWMATEYVPGPDLAAAVRDGGTLGADTVRRLVAELGRALAALAAAGVVHRDLKPSNVLLSVEGAHVIDFGISKAADASAITGTGNRVGTPAYMSPEYLRTGHCDTASDVFSLACTLLYAATGRAPFGDGTGVDVMHRVAFEEPNPEVTGALTAADPELGALLTACLAKEPERRPTPQELIDAAGTQSGTPAWPEPLHGEVLARQRAYETLHRLPVERAAALRPTDYRDKAASASPPAQPGPAPAPEPEPSSPETASTTARPWRRRKQVLAAVAGTALCAVAASAFALMREGGPARAVAPETVATAVGAPPGDLPQGPASPSATGVPSGASTGGASGKGSEIAVAEGAPQPAGSAPLGDEDPQSTPGSASTPAGGAGPSTAASPSPDPTPTVAATPPWIADCTYYAGYARTVPGATGKRVLQAQCMLTKRGYDVGSGGVNGEFGPETETAVRAFQSARGLRVNGIVTRATWIALRSAV